MIILWITLFLIHQGHTLVPVKTVQLGEPATITCAIPKEFSSRGVHWYKQSFGETLKLIVTVFKSTEPTFGPEFTSLKFDIGDDFASLTILKADQDDEGIYHCANTERIGVKWSGTYLLVKGNTQRTSNYTVSQLQIESNPVRSGDTMTLQCSVFSDSDKTCPGGLNVLWVRTGANQAHPNIIYTDTNRSNECEKSSDPQNRCVFRFNKNVSSSDAGTYYCAVATCGEILFGNGFTLELESTQSVFIQSTILIVCLAISVTGNAFLIFNQQVCKSHRGNEGALSDIQTETSHQLTEEADDELNYAALNFSERKTRGKRKREGAEDSVYSQISVKMIVMWITMFFLHQGHSLVPVKTVQLGEAATLTCALPIKEFGSITVHWYKQSPGDGLRLIVTLSKSAPPEYSPEFSRKRFNVENANNFCNLTVLKTVQKDEGIYHCGIAEWLYPIQWSETYLSVKGNTQMRSNYTVVQWPTVLDPLQPGESVTLQCSIISVFGKTTCPEDLSVFWFRAGSNKSHPNVIYTDGNTRDECDNRSETQKRCVYRFSKNVSSSDAGTYYCAVDTCGEILFGNGTALKLVQPAQSVFPQMLILIVCLAISFIGNVFLIFSSRVCKPFKGKESAISESQTDKLNQPIEADDQLNYAALNFSERKTRGRRKRDITEDSVYSQVKC
ncbi:uncharacterized protein LOC106097350 [Oreochromis niloticus]|nr:uncharacterized protein LOC106097350 [Oreochromis niloticus]